MKSYKALQQAVGAVPSCMMESVVAGAASRMDLSKNGLCQGGGKKR